MLFSVVTSVNKLHQVVYLVPIHEISGSRWIRASKSPAERCSWRDCWKEEYRGFVGVLVRPTFGVAAISPAVREWSWLCVRYSVHCEHRPKTEIETDRHTEQRHKISMKNCEAGETLPPTPCSAPVEGMLLTHGWGKCRTTWEWGSALRCAPGDWLQRLGNV